MFKNKNLILIHSENFALSAAHCLEFGSPANRLELRAGSTTWEDGQAFDVVSYENHPNYDTRSLDNDVAVIRTLNSMAGDNIVSIPLPPVCTAACCGTCVDGDDVVVTGWGIFDTDRCEL